jgi:hypothetical protein
MRHVLVIAAAVLLYRGDPHLFGWNATGFRTLLVFTVITVVVTLVPRSGNRG